MLSDNLIRGSDHTTIHFSKYPSSLGSIISMMVLSANTLEQMVSDGLLWSKLATRRPAISPATTTLITTAVAGRSAVQDRSVGMAGAGGRVSVQSSTHRVNYVVCWYCSGMRGGGAGLSKSFEVVRKQSNFHRPMSVDIL